MYDEAPMKRGMHKMVPHRSQPLAAYTLVALGAAMWLLRYHRAT
jgi:hypothetical protein